VIIVDKKKKIQPLSYILIILIGIILRTYHLFIVGFSKPWRFGGLYLEFARQIYLNNYAFSERIPYYTLGGLPFAYPPLPFYIESFLVFTLGFPEFLIVNLLPVVLSVLSLIMFYVLIIKFFKNQYAQLISLAFYSLFPICYAEQLEGAGLAESFGTLFIILLILAFWYTYKKPYQIPRLLLTAFTWALTVMASPASAYLSVFIFLTYFLLILKKGKTNLKKLVLHTLLLGVLAILISGIYWIPVVRNHGLELMIDSFTTQHNGGLFIISFFIRLVEMNIIDTEPILSLLFLIAICVLAYYKKYEMLLVALISALIPRENWIMGIIGILTIGYAIELISQNNLVEFKIKKNQGFFNLFIGILIFSLLFLRPFYFMITRGFETEDTLDEAQIQFLGNLRENKALDDTLVIVGSDEFLEWSPYLTEKTVLNVWYGTEFDPDKEWIFNFHYSLIDCGSSTCINKLVKENFGHTDFSVIVDLEYMEGFQLGYLDEISINNRFVIFSQ